MLQPPSGLVSCFTTKTAVIVVQIKSTKSLSLITTALAAVASEKTIFLSEAPAASNNLILGLHKAYLQIMDHSWCKTWICWR